MKKLIFDAAHPVKVTGTANKRKACEMASKVNGKVIETSNAYLTNSRLGWIAQEMLTDEDRQSYQWALKMSGDKWVSYLLCDEEGKNTWVDDDWNGAPEILPIEEVLTDSEPLFRTIRKGKRLTFRDLDWIDHRGVQYSFAKIVAKVIAEDEEPEQ